MKRNLIIFFFYYESDNLKVILMKKTTQRETTFVPAQMMTDFALFIIQTVYRADFRLTKLRQHYCFRYVEFLFTPL